MTRSAQVNAPTMNELEHCEREKVNVNGRRETLNALCERALQLRGDELDRLGELWVSASSKEREEARNLALDAAQEAGRVEWDMAYDFFTETAEDNNWGASRNSALDALLDASLAITVRDLITGAQFNVLYDAWARMAGE